MDWEFSTFDLMSIVRFLRLMFVLVPVGLSGQPIMKAVLIPVDGGWASNSINTVAFRKNSVVSWKEFQFVAYYDPSGFVVLGKRTLGTPKWTLQKTLLTGNAKDAHNSISLMTDGDGFVHLSWNQHNTPLQYCRSKSPGSLDLDEPARMTGQREERVTYPEFHRLSDGNLIFLYRDGESGNGNLVVNFYNKQSMQWSTLHANLIHGEGKRNAYWQACTDRRGVLHLSWVWRESPDVASNHDLCYARSKDGGKTWEKSTGEKYVLPITRETAEYAMRVPQQRELINQTSMVADEQGNPMIATYWRDSSSQVPQYHLVYQSNGLWKDLSLNFRTTPFSLSGVGTKEIPIARPQVVSQGSKVFVIFRDRERGNKVSVAIGDLRKRKWNLMDLTTTSVGAWEPTFDSELWKDKGVLHLFVQHVEQSDAEGLTQTPPRLVYILEWSPPIKIKNTLRN
jgi:hypothetical protein